MPHSFYLIPSFSNSASARGPSFRSTPKGRRECRKRCLHGRRECFPARLYESDMGKTLGGQSLSRASSNSLVSRKFWSKLISLRQVPWYSGCIPPPHHDRTESAHSINETPRLTNKRTPAHFQDDTAEPSKRNSGGVVERGLPFASRTHENSSSASP